jgi:HEAT repeat protein
MKEKTESRYLWFVRINALSFASTADTVLILYAIRVGADDFLVGLIVSFLYLTMPLMLLGKKSIVNRGAAKTIARGWLFRNISALTLVFIPPIQKHGQPALGLLILVAGAFGFFAFRSYGTVADMPLISDISSPQSQGRFVAKISFQFNLFYLAAMISIVAILNRFPSISAFQGILLFGGVNGIFSQFIVRGVSETQQPRLSAREPLIEDVNYIVKNHLSKKLLIAWSLCLASIVLVIPFSMISLKNGYGISDYGALSFFIVQVVGSIIAAYVNTLLLDRVGSRPVAIIYTSAMTIICLLWITAPAHFKLAPILTVFLIAGLCNAGIQTAFAHYLLVSAPSGRIVGISMIMAMVTCTAAGIAGTLFGGALLHLIRSLNFAGLAVYRIYFLVILLVVFGAMILTIRLQPLADKGVKDVLGILFSIKDWRALFALQKTFSPRNEEQEHEIIEKLGEIRSDLSEMSLVSYLDSPSFITRTHAMRALGEISFGDNTARKLIEELGKGEHTTAFLAAEILGEHRVAKATPSLRKALNSEDIFLRGKAMLALAQLGDIESYPKIAGIFTGTENPRLLIHGGRAFVYIDEKQNLSLLMQKIILPFIAQSVRDELLYSLCDLCGVGDIFYRLYPLFKNDRKSLRREMSGIIQGVKARNRKLYDDLKMLQDSWRDFEINGKMRFADCPILLRKIDRPGCLKELVEFLDREKSISYPEEVCFAIVLIITACGAQGEILP